MSINDTEIIHEQESEQYYYDEQRHCIKAMSETQQCHDRDVYEAILLYRNKHEGCIADVNGIYRILHGNLKQFVTIERMNKERGFLRSGNIIVSLIEQNGFVNTHIPKKRWHQIISAHKKSIQWVNTGIMAISKASIETHLHRLMQPPVHYRIGHLTTDQTQQFKVYEKWKQSKIPYEYCWLREDNVKIHPAHWNMIVDLFEIDWRCHPLAKRNTIKSVYDVFGKHISIAMIMHTGCYIMRLYQCRQKGHTIIKYITYDPRKPSEWILNMNNDIYKDVPELIRWRAYGQPSFEDFLVLDNDNFMQYILGNWETTKHMNHQQQYEYYNARNGLIWIEFKYRVTAQPFITHNVNLDHLHNYVWY